MNKEPLIYVQLPVGYKAHPIGFVDIARIVCNYSGISLKELQSPSRPAHIRDARNTFCYLCMKYSYTTLKDLGNFLGGRDHTTIISSRDRIKQQIFERHDYAKQVEVMEEMVQKKILPKAYLRSAKAA